MEFHSGAPNKFARGVVCHMLVIFDTWHMAPRNRSCGSVQSRVFKRTYEKRRLHGSATGHDRPYASGRARRAQSMFKCSSWHSLCTHSSLSTSTSKCGRYFCCRCSGGRPDQVLRDLRHLLRGSQRCSLSVVPPPYDDARARPWVRRDPRTHAAPSPPTPQGAPSGISMRPACLEGHVCNGRRWCSALGGGDSTSMKVFLTRISGATASQSFSAGGTGRQRC